VSLIYPAAPRFVKFALLSDTSNSELNRLTAGR
jgi:hypothetical protein